MQTKLVLKQRSALKLRFQPGATGPQGAQGIQGIQGIQGFKGWSPILATVTDGVRRVLQVSDWTGGEGVKPASGSYIGPTGLVSNIANAVDIRGAQGPSGSVTDGDKGDITVSSAGTVWTIDSDVLSTAGRAVAGAASTAAQRTALGLAINVDVQAFDYELLALASVASSANKLPYFTGPGAADVTDLTSFARTYLDDANGDAVFTTLGAAKSFAAAGYQKLPSGLIIQWGAYTAGGQDPVMAWPITFPNACLVASATTRNANPAAQLTSVAIIGTSTTVGQFGQRYAVTGAVGSGAYPFDWIAIGY